MKIGEVLKSWRLHKEINLREASSKIGIGHATLMRIEHGKHFPDSKTFMKILNWLMSE